MNREQSRRRSALREFWNEYKRSPWGLVGLVLFGLFLFVALAAPWLTPYDPLKDQFLADPMARPGWMRHFTKYKDAPVTVDAFLLRSWETASISNVDVTWDDRGGEEVMIVSGVDEGEGRLVLEHPFVLDSNPPDTFFIQVPYAFTGEGGATGTMTMRLVDPKGQSHTLWQSRILRGNVRSTTQRIDSRDMQLKMRLGYTPFANLAAELLNARGEYRFALDFELNPAPAPGVADPGAARSAFTIGESRFRIPGQLHGPLGTDHLGADLWSQFVYGTRTSLMIGFIVAGMAVLLGTFVGVVAGYIGRWVDELLMRIVDVLIAVPFLPILIVVVAIVGKNIWTLIALVAVFSWMGIARLVRSQALTLRERAFVEAARAAGASPTYIMKTHILPNVLGLVFASLVLLVPGAIVTEATLSFLGFGDPRVPTWGRMLQNARGFGAFGELAWWWILPPGLALTILAMAFVFMGNTLDDMLNRRSNER